MLFGVFPGDILGGSFAWAREKRKRAFSGGEKRRKENFWEDNQRGELARERMSF